MSRNYFATVQPTRIAPEAETKMSVEVFSYSQSECDHVDGWELPTEFSHAELLSSFDAHGWIVLDGGSFRYVSPAEAFDYKEVEGMRITYTVVEIPPRPTI